MGDIIVRLDTPHPGQARVIRCKKRFIVLMCGRRWGKSNVAANRSIKNMLKGLQVAYITPEYSLAKEFLKQLLKRIPPALIEHKNETDLEITLITGGRIKFFSGNAIDNMRGRKFHDVIIDEAAFIVDLQSAWNESIRPTLTDYSGTALFISTPKGRGFFDAMYTKGCDLLSSEWASFHFTSYDNPFLNPAEIDAARNDIPLAMFLQEYMAEPGEDAANPFGSEYIAKSTLLDLSKQPTVCYGIDIAKYNDNTSITGMDKDGRMTYHDVFRMPWEATKQRIAALPAGINMVLDSTGVGSVVLEDLQLLGLPIEGFTFTSASKAPLIYEFITDIQKGGCMVNERTASEMRVFEYKHAPGGGIKFEAMAGYHDDCVASAAICNRYRKQYAYNYDYRHYTA